LDRLGQFDEQTGELDQARQAHIIELNQLAGE
jgi:hypothetical protein